MSEWLTGSGRRWLPAVLLLLLAAGLLTAVLVWPAGPQPAVVLAGPAAFSGPVHGGCFLLERDICRLQIDSTEPLTTDTGQALVGFQLLAQREGIDAWVLLHDFRTDVSNPPRGSYQPSAIKQSYAAECSVTYRLEMRVKDSGDTDFETVGMTNWFTCPMAAPTATPRPTATSEPTPVVEDWVLYLPLVMRPSPPVGPAG